MVAPFRELFALIILDGDADLPQHLLVHLADRCAQRPNRGRGIEIENRHEVLMLEVLFRIQPTAGHQGVGDADGGGGLKLDFDVEIIVLLQKRTVNDIAEVLLMLVPILTGQLSGHINKLLGKIVDKTFNAGMKMEFETVDNRNLQYSYEDGDNFVFMDMTTYDQIFIPKTLVGDQAKFLLEGTDCVVSFHDGTPLSVELPASVVLTVTHTEPGLQGNRSNAGTKPATVETGAEIQVPLFIGEGEKVKVNTTDGSYLGREN